jgi:Ser/Thr protein kinase RdoA (MazF antagonist)
VLEYIEGDVLAIPQDPFGDLVLGRWPDAWRSDEALGAAGRLLRGLHDAAHGFRTEHARWRLHDHPMQPGEIICHGDAAPWNAVYRDGLPFALIDFDSARPDTPLLDLASAAWHFVPLADARTAGVLGFGEVAYGERLGVFLDAYGLADRTAFAEALQRVKTREAAYPLFWRLGPAATASYLDHVAEQLRWLASRSAELERALA